MKRTNIKKAVREYIRKSDATHRYRSWDYCYNYFLTTSDLKKDLEKSCLVLGFYLASWGMFRGASFLLQKSARHFESTIDLISKQPRSLWKIDVDNYTDENFAKIISVYKEIKDCLIIEGKAHATLTTKVLLGVFGFVPAFDNYFSNTFREISDGECGFRCLTPKALGIIKEFYEKNHRAIDHLSQQTLTIDFKTGQKTRINYPKAKIIDMYGFTIGQQIAAQTQPNNFPV